MTNEPVVKFLAQDFEQTMISKILITGPLHPSMPYIVLSELALELGLLVSIDRLKNDIQYYAKIFKKLSKLRPKLVSDLSIDKEFIKKYINPLVEWDLLSLDIAFRFLNLFRRPLVKIDDLEIDKDTTIGLQTPEIRISLNACILYALCKYHHLYVDIDCTLEDMKSLLLMNKQNVNPKHSEEIVIDDEIPSKPFCMYDSIEKIEQEASLFGDKDYVIRLVEPKSHLQAIIVGALVHQMDYSKYIDPLREFNRHKHDLKTSKVDVEMQYVEWINPNYCDLNLYFNPYLPRTVYSEQMLNQHLSLFSYSPSEFFGTPYYILQEMHLHENFHLGYHPNICNSELAVTLEPVSSLSNGDIVCFGVREEVLSATSWDELSKVFSNMNQFTNIFEKSRIFSKTQIDRLTRLGNWILDCSITHKYLFEDFSERTLSSVKECLDVIDEINLTLCNNFEHNQHLIHLFKNSSTDKRVSIIMAMEKLFEVVMYMRGWDGQSDVYPIEDSPYKNSEQVEIKTLEAIFELDNLNESTENFIYQLPLMIWKNEFVQSVLEEQGLNIGDRIKIVKKGETEGIQSCIRMTSNVLGATYCFYCKLFKIPEKFNIKNLTYIQ